MYQLNLLSDLFDICLEVFKGMFVPVLQSVFGRFETVWDTQIWVSRVSHRPGWLNDFGIIKMIGPHRWNPNDFGNYGCVLSVCRRICE